MQIFESWNYALVTPYWHTYFPAKEIVHRYYSSGNTHTRLTHKGSRPHLVYLIDAELGAWLAPE